MNLPPGTPISSAVTRTGPTSPPGTSAGAVVSAPADGHCCCVCGQLGSYVILEMSPRAGKLLCAQCHDSEMKAYLSKRTPSRKICSWCHADLGPSATEFDSHGACGICGEKLRKAAEAINLPEPSSASLRAASGGHQTAGKINLPVPVLAESFGCDEAGSSSQDCSTAWNPRNEVRESNQGRETETRPVASWTLAAGKTL